MLHHIFIFWIVKISLLNHDFVVQRRNNNAVNYFIRVLFVSLWESGKSVLAASDTLKVQKLLWVIYTCCFNISRVIK